MKEIAIGLIAGALIAMFLVLASAEAHGQENCPLDWHPPPCGKPPEPVKNNKLEAVKNAERYHWQAAALFAVAVAASCGPPLGDPRIDTPRRLMCRTSAIVGAVALAAQQWEKRLIEEINAARDGGTQFVALLPDNSLTFAVDLDTGGNEFLTALVDHGQTIEWLGGLIVDSVRTTFDCDAWAQYDVRGIECGDNQRAWTDQLFKWQGQRYFQGVAAMVAVLADQLEPDVDIVGAEFIQDLDDNMNWNGWIGWEFQQ